MELDGDGDVVTLEMAESLFHLAPYRCTTAGYGDALYLAAAAEAKSCVRIKAQSSNRQVNEKLRVKRGKDGERTNLFHPVTVQGVPRGAGQPWWEAEEPLSPHSEQHHPVTLMAGTNLSQYLNNPPRKGQQPAS